MRLIWIPLFLVLCVGCTHGVFSQPSLQLHYKSASPQVPLKGGLVLQTPDISFSKDFIPHYYQRKYIQALQRDGAALLVHLGYSATPNAPHAHLSGSVRLVFENTPSTLKDTKAMLKATGNEYVDPVRVLRMLRAQSTLKLTCVGGDQFPCGVQVHVQVLEPVWRANPLDSDPSAHASDEQRYNIALIEALNKLYQQSLQTLETQINHLYKE
ncbi:hypothetical protein [Helicobacter salomonis]|uniref:hypothetical protein n=1 Tax=Helicobacter salomonis TaxID=56878 RepID=UPI000CF18BEA|nr:hypothetical protein [Helicobacter salomonis]